MDVYLSTVVTVPLNEMLSLLGKSSRWYLMMAGWKRQEAKQTNVLMFGLATLVSSILCFQNQCLSSPSSHSHYQIYLKNQDNLKNSNSRCVFFSQKDIVSVRRGKKITFRSFSWHLTHMEKKIQRFSSHLLFKNIRHWKACHQFLKSGKDVRSSVYKYESSE